MLKLPLVFVAMALALIADVCNAGLTPPLDASDSDEFVRQNSRRMLDSEAPVTKKELATEDNCSDFNDSCQGCLQRHCVFVVYQPYETKCMDGKLTLADLNREDPDKSISSFILNAAQCPPEANAINSQLRQVSLSDETTTTTDTTPSTTSNSTTSSTITTTTSPQPSTTNSTTARYNLIEPFIILQLNQNCALALQVQAASLLLLLLLQKARLSRPLQHQLLPLRLRHRFCQQQQQKVQIPGKAASLMDGAFLEESF